MIGWLLFPPPTSRHFIEESRLLEGGGSSGFGTGFVEVTAAETGESRAAGEDGGARGPAGFLRVSRQDTRERRRRLSERGWVLWVPRPCRAGRRGAG